MAEKVLFRKLRGNDSVRQRPESESYPETTSWQFEVDGSRVPIATLTRMYRRVRITFFSTGQTSFCVPYPFGDISDVEREALIDEAKRSVRDLKIGEIRDFLGELI